MFDFVNFLYVLFTEPELRCEYYFTILVLFFLLHKHVTCCYVIVNNSQIERKMGLECRLATRDDLFLIIFVTVYISLMFFSRIPYFDIMNCGKQFPI